MSKLKLVYSISLLLAACFGNSCKPQGCPWCPSINQVLPSHGQYNDEITLVGDFSRADPTQDSVTVNGIKSRGFKKINNNKITFRVPARCGPGEIAISGSDLRSDDVDALIPVPIFQIDSVKVTGYKIDASGARRGRDLIIQGKNFPNHPSWIRVYFRKTHPQNPAFPDSVLANVVAVNDSLLLVTIPNEALSGYPVVVEAFNDGTADLGPDLPLR